MKICKIHIEVGVDNDVQELIDVLTEFKEWVLEKRANKAEAKVEVEGVYTTPVEAEVPEPKEVPKEAKPEDTKVDVPYMPEPIPAPETTPEPVPTAEPKKGITLEAISMAGAKLIQASPDNMLKLQQAIAGFGVQSIGQLPKEQYEAFAGALREMGADI